jgi:uncharacterized protein DUF402
MTDSRFSTGEAVVWRIVWHGRVWWAVPVTVVEDGEIVALYVAPGTLFKAGQVLGGDPRLPTEWRLVDRVWENHVLQLTRPGEAHSVWALRPSATEQLAYWYVNLQDPLTRTSIGFDTRDNMLDVVVEPDLSAWRWKDERDVEAAVRTGLLSRREAGAVRREGERVVGLIEAGTPPFDPGWATWRPDSRWRVPTLRPGWSEVPPHSPDRLVERS